MASHIQRRKFLATLGGAAAAWPLAARAQQPTTPVIGLLDPRSPDAMADRLRAFRLGLKDVGYVEGENVTIIYRFAEHQYDRLPDSPSLPPKTLSGSALSPASPGRAVT